MGIETAAAGGCCWFGMRSGLECHVRLMARIESGRGLVSDLKNTDIRVECAIMNVNVGMGAIIVKAGRAGRD